MDKKEVQKMIDDSVTRFFRRERFYFDRPVGFFQNKPVGQQGDDVGKATNAYGLTVNAPEIYYGHFNSTANSNKLPEGWSISVVTGTYTITHNLGDTNYVVLTTPRDTAEKMGMLEEKNNNDFVLRYTTETATEFATAGEFIVIRYNN